MKALLISLLVVTSIIVSAQERYVLMVSFDGFRYDYAEKYDLPNFQYLAREGASTDRMIPSFPSKTFPNHYTLVTGLFPGNHGLVDNSFYDPESGSFYTSHNKEMVTNPVFYGGNPLWQLVQKYGMRSAAYFWVGSEAPINGSYPDIWKPYNQKFPNDARIDSVFKWYSYPKEERPNLVTLYFSLVDSFTHKYGPDNPKSKESFLEADRLLGRLIEGINNSELPIDLVVVSDHGMYPMKNAPDTYIDIGELVRFPRNVVKIANSETHVHLYFEEPRMAECYYDSLKSKENNFKVYRIGDFPEKWHYGESARSGDILLVAFEGHGFKKIGTDSYGSHGFDPYTVKEMGSIFYAWGPSIKKNIGIDSFENVHIYPFICYLLGIEPPENDGDVNVLKAVVNR